MCIMRRKMSIVEMEGVGGQKESSERWKDRERRGEESRGEKRRGKERSVQEKRRGEKRGKQRRGHTAHGKERPRVTASTDPPKLRQSY